MLDIDHFTDISNCGCKEEGCIMERETYYNIQLPKDGLAEPEREREVLKSGGFIQLLYNKTSIVTMSKSLNCLQKRSQKEEDTMIICENKKRKKEEKVNNYEL